MRDASGRGCSVPGTPTRDDLPLHDMTGGNAFVPDIIADFFPAEVDATALTDAKARAQSLLAKAASLDLTATQVGANRAVLVRVTNETAHKLPSGYPEGRRMWLNVRGYDAGDVLVYESGAYDDQTGDLAHDADLVAYEIKPGVSRRLGGALGVEPGPSFHFVLNDTVWSDNRIPPRGFTNAAFAAIQSPPVGRVYEDGQYWDDRTFVMPPAVERVSVRLFYQTTSKEYVTFLRDENVTNSLGQELYESWVAHGRASPVAMASAEIDLGLLAVDGPEVGDTNLHPVRPNPASKSTAVGFTLAEAGRARVDVFDVRGRRVATLVDRELGRGSHAVSWRACTDHGIPVSPGRYFARLEAGGRSFVREINLVR